jgi:hypothetical protein
MKETQELLSLAPTFKDAGSIEDASTRAGVEIELTKKLGIRSRIPRWVPAGMAKGFSNIYVKYAF